MHRTDFNKYLHTLLLYAFKYVFVGESKDLANMLTAETVNRITQYHRKVNTYSCTSEQ